MASPETTIDDLPDEVLVIIMGFLPATEDIVRCSMVCHRWHGLTTQETLWRKAKIKRSTVLSLRALAKLVQRGIRCFDLNSVIVRDPETWSRIFTPPTYKSRMTSLDLTKCVCSPRAFQCLLKPMNELRKLRVGNTFRELSRRCCAAIARNTQLRSLDLNGCCRVNTHGLALILKNCQRLEELNLKETCLRDVDMDLLSAKLPATLLRLNLSNQGELEDYHLSEILNVCPNLTRLDISDNPGLSEMAIEAAEASRNWQEFNCEQSWVGVGGPLGGVMYMMVMLNAAYPAG